MNKQAKPPVRGVHTALQLCAMGLPAGSVSNFEVGTVVIILRQAHTPQLPSIPVLYTDKLSPQNPGKSQLVAAPTFKLGPAIPQAQTPWPSLSEM